MKAIVNTGSGKLELLDWPTPQPGPGQVRVRVGACAICATDLLMIAGWQRTGFPSIPGHEWAGTVDAVGAGVDAALVGRKCVADNVQPDGGEVGFEHPGGYGQFLLTQAANVRTLDNAFDNLPAATLIEPTAVCCRAISRLTHGRKSDALGKSLIFGDGPIGLILLAMLCAKGIEPEISTGAITLVGGHDRRLEWARSLRPAGVRTVNYHALKETQFVSGLLDSLSSGADRLGYDTIIEATGSPLAIDACAELAAARARILMLGDYREHRANFSWFDAQVRELEIIGSNAGAGGWDQAVAIAQTGKAPLAKLVTHVVAAENFAEAFQLVRGRRDDVIKVVLKWE